MLLDVLLVGSKLASVELKVDATNVFVASNLTKSGNGWTTTLKPLCFLNAKNRITTQPKLLLTAHSIINLNFSIPQTLNQL